MPNSNNKTQQAPQQPLSNDTILVSETILPPDSTSLLYYMRQEKPAEMQWLRSLFQTKTLDINQFNSSVPNLIQSRRNQLIEERIGKKVGRDTTTSDTLRQVIEAPGDTITQFQDTSQTIPKDTAQYIPQDTLPQKEEIKQDKDSKVESKIRLVEEVAAKTDNLKEGINSLISTTDLVLILLIFSFFVSTWARVRFPQIMRQMFISIIAYSESYKIYRENNRMARQFYWALGFVFSVNLSLFLLLNVKFFNVPIFGIDGLALFSIIFLFVVTVYFFKRLILRTIGQLFMAYRVAEEYWFSVSTINRVLGIVFFPFIIAIPYVPQFIQPYLVQVTWGVVGLSFLFRLIRGIRVAIEKHLSVLYMILYFCTLEILPIILVTKFLTRWVSIF